MRFELIDRVVQRRADALTAIKAVTRAEEYLADHFPGFAVLPGVLMLEALVQAARRLVLDRDTGSTGNEKAPAPVLVLREVRNVRYGSFVMPGEVLVVRVTLRRCDAGSYEFEGAGQVNGETAVQGRFRMEAVGRAS